MSKQQLIQAGKNLLSKTSKALRQPANRQPVMPGDEDIPTDTGRFIRIGTLILVLGFGGFSLWAIFAQLGSAVISQGEVVVESYRKNIQHLEGGLVQDIKVRDGNLVQQGDLLVQLDTTQWQGEMRTAHQRMFSSLIELERLQHEQQLAEKIRFSDRVQQAAAESEDLTRVLEQQRRLFNARIQGYLKEQQTLTSRVQQTLAVVNGLQQQHQLLNQQITLLEEEQLAYATLQDEQLGDGTRARELARQALSLRNEAARLLAEEERTRLQASEYEVQIANNQQTFQKDVGERIRTAQNEYFDAQERYLVMKDRVERSAIRAPEPGIIVNMQLHTIGSVISPGQKIMELVPQSDQFVIETRVQTQDINSVYIGQQADIRFSAFDQRQTPIIDGQVIHISADRLIDEQNNQSYYLARIQLTEQGYLDLGTERRSRLLPGMPAEVMLRRESRTFMSYLMKPLVDSFARSFKEK